jgi:hypothetical protein
LWLGVRGWTECRTLAPSRFKKECVREKTPIPPPASTEHFASSTPLADGDCDPPSRPPQRLIDKAELLRRVPVTIGNPKAGLVRDERGRIKAGPGRPKGTLNKVGQEAKHAIALAFEGIGGIDALIDWAKKNHTNRAIS